MSKIFLYGLSFLVLFSNVYAGAPNYFLEKFKNPITKSNQNEKFDSINKEDDIDNENFSKQMYSKSVQQLPVNKNSIKQQSITNSTPPFSINQENINDSSKMNEESNSTPAPTFVIPSHDEEQNPYMSYNPYALNKNTDSNNENVKNPYKSVQVKDNKHSRININKSNETNSNIENISELNPTMIESIQQENNRNNEINPIIKNSNLQENNINDKANSIVKSSNLKESRQSNKMDHIAQKEGEDKNTINSQEKGIENDNKLKKELALKLIEAINSIKSEIKVVQSQVNNIAEEQKINHQKANEYMKKKGEEVDALYDGMEKAGLILIEHSDGSSTLTTKSKTNINKSLNKNNIVQKKSQFNKILTLTNTIYPSRDDYKNNITIRNR